MTLYIRYLCIAIFLLTSAILVSAQSDICDVGSTPIIEQVNETCSGVGANEACYGNREINIATHENVTDVPFDEPGALININSIRSIFLSEVNEREDTWGVAQLRLVVNQGNGVQDVSMLLFGDVTVENQVEDIRGTPTTVRSEAQIFPIAPAQGFEATFTLEEGQTVEAIGRLQTMVWVQIIVPETGENGWVFKSSLDIDDDTFASLPIKDGSAPLFGSMQALTFASGTSPCENTVADGLIIQTPDGRARVNFLINEVTIELTGAGEGATVFLQANPDSGEMDVNVLDGTTYVSAGPNTQQVDAGNQTSIPMSVDLRPLDAPSQPRSFDAQMINTIPVLPIVRNPGEPYIPPANPQISRAQAIESSDVSLVVGSISYNGGDDNITISSQGAGSTNISNSSSTGTGSGSTNTTSGNGLPGSITGSGNANSDDDIDTEETDSDTQIEIQAEVSVGWFSGVTGRRNFAFATLVLIGLAFLGWLTYESYKD